MIHTLSRYYSNAFSDADKQNAINIFLGVFEPSAYNFSLTELEKDCYLHDKFIMEPWKNSKNYIEWINKNVFKCLPLAYDQEYKSFENFLHVEPIKSKEDTKINEFDNFYKPFELSAFHETFFFNNLSTNRVSNTAPMANSGGNFSGNIISMFDPFKNRNKKSNALSQK